MGRCGRCVVFGRIAAWRDDGDVAGTAIGSQVVESERCDKGKFAGWEGRREGEEWLREESSCDDDTTYVYRRS